MKDPISILNKPFPDSAIEVRYDGLDYVRWKHYSNRLNEAFGLDWSIEITGRLSDATSASVSVRLTHPVYDDKGGRVGTATKEAIGGAKRRNKNQVMGECEASALSYALKKAATLMGVGADLPCFEDIAEIDPDKSPTKKKVAKKKVAKKVGSTRARGREKQIESAIQGETRVELDAPETLDDVIDAINRADSKDAVHALMRGMKESDRGLVSAHINAKLTSLNNGGGAGRHGRR